MLARRINERLQRIAAEIRVHRQGVGMQGTLGRRIEIGAGVSLRGAADVAALRVEDHEQTFAHRMRDHISQRFDSPMP